MTSSHFRKASSFNLEKNGNVSARPLEKATPSACNVSFAREILSFFSPIRWSFRHAVQRRAAKTRFRYAVSNAVAIMLAGGGYNHC